MSHSAPHSHPLEYEIADLPLPTQQYTESTLISGTDHLTREVQRTISLTSENPSEMFFSAEEDISNMMSQGGSIKNRNGSIVFSGKKRFSSDLRYSICFWKLEFVVIHILFCASFYLALVRKMKMPASRYPPTAAIWKYMRRNAKLCRSVHKAPQNWYA